MSLEAAPPARGDGEREPPVQAAPASVGPQPAAAPEPEFEVIGVRSLRHAAIPTLLFDLDVSEPSGRQIYMIALTVQVMIEPARRAYDADTHERLAGLFGAPERWAVTTRSLVWVQCDVLVPAFTGKTTVGVPIQCSYDMEVAAAKYLYALPDGEAPLALHFNGIVYYPNEEGALQMVLVPWSRSIGFRMPVSAFREAIREHYPDAGWIALGSRTLAELERARVARALPTMDACVRELLREAADG
jgi:Family of unknown function (DUF6084)